MSSKGTLYMIPCTLGDSEPMQVLPISVKNTIHKLDEFIVENSKTARAFLKKMEIPIPQSELKLHILNKRTEDAELAGFLKSCEDGKSIGLISEAGCPGVADPGAEVVYIAHQRGIKVMPLVGPSSILLALMGSGMSGQSFSFHGYIPIDRSDRKKKLKELERLSIQHKQTQLFIETPYRNDKMFEDLLQVLNPKTMLCVACELTLDSQELKTLSAGQWKKTKKPNLHKRPSIFLIYNA
jgi:16S rRNA (cytidine1402-2'-O)-methyltransferase